MSSEYATVEADQTDQALGESGGVNYLLAGLLLIPQTTSPGAVSVRDGDGDPITLFEGGAGSVSNLVPFFIPLGVKSRGGAWKVTTGANLSVVALGSFT